MEKYSNDYKFDLYHDVTIEIKLLIHSLKGSFMFNELLNPIQISKEYLQESA